MPLSVIVIGLGAVGTAVCDHLARRGVRVLGLEQFSIPHALGSSHGDSRMIRLCYYEHPNYVPLLLRSYELWEDLERRSGQRLLHITGAVYTGAADGELVSGSLRSAREHDLPHELLDRAALRERYPQLDLLDDAVGLYEPRGGYLLPELVIAAQAEQAMRCGAELHGHEPVRAIDADGAGVVVTTDRATYRADRAIVCGGAWSGKLLRELCLPLTVTRQIIGWVWPRRPERFERPNMGVWAVDQPGGGLFYGFPLMTGRPGVKVALHQPAEPTDPDTVERRTTPDDEQSFRPLLRRHVPDADGPLLSMAVCLYTNTPDGHFIIDRHPAHEQILYAAGLSGHGFKFAPVIGEALADLALEGATTLPVGFLGARRVG